MFSPVEDFESADVTPEFAVRRHAHIEQRRQRYVQDCLAEWRQIMEEVCTNVF